MWRRPSWGIEAWPGCETMDGGPAREEAAGGRPEEGAPEEMIEILSFRLGSEMYAFPMEGIQEIVRLYAVTAVPGTPPYLRGITSLRGRMIPVLDLKARLNVTAEGEGAAVGRDKGKTIVVRGPRGPIGVMVDLVTGVKRLPESALMAPPPHMGGDEARFLSGVVVEDGRFISLLRMDTVLELEGPSTAEDGLERRREDGKA